MEPNHDSISGRPLSKSNGMWGVYWSTGMERVVAEKIHILHFFVSLSLCIWVSWLTDDFLLLLLFIYHVGRLSTLCGELPEGGLTCAIKVVVGVNYLAHNVLMRDSLVILSVMMIVLIMVSILGELFKWPWAQRNICIFEFNLKKLLIKCHMYKFRNSRFDISFGSTRYL